MSLASLFKRTGNTKAEDLTQNNGLVTVSIRVKLVERGKRELKVIIAEQATNKTVYKSTYTDVKSNTDYFATVKAAEIVQLYCRNNDYVILDKDIIDNLDDDAQPKIKTSSKRTR